MKHLTFILAIGLLLIACGTSKKVVASETPTQVEVTDPVEVPILEEAPVIEPEVIPVVLEEEVSEEVSEEIIVEIPVPSEVFDHTSFDELLRNYVSEDGTVNYKGLTQQKQTLRNYIAALGENTPVDTWTKEDKLAYWMNAYNAMTIDLIIRNYPLASIKDIKDPWDQRLWKLGSKWYNLNEIEHQILRKMDDPRIHFGINCASFSCPPLDNEAFTAATVDAQLNDLAVGFINDTKRNTITASSVSISKIFSWFAKDFKTEGTLIDFLNSYSEVQIDPKARKRFKDYNWSLNE